MLISLQVVFYLERVKKMAMRHLDVNVQNASGVEFACDVNGRMQYASFGGQSNRTLHFPQFLGWVEQIILWVLGFTFGSKDAQTDFCAKIKPLVITACARQRGRGKFSGDNVTDIVTLLWLVLSGQQGRAKPFNPNIGTLSNFVEYQTRRYFTKLNREHGKARKLDSLGVITQSDDDSILDSLGSKGLFGLIFEPADGDHVRRKFVSLKTKKEVKNYDTSPCTRLEDKRGLKKLLNSLPKRDKDILSLYFIKINPETGKTYNQTQIAEKLGISKVWVGKELVRLLNTLRSHYGIEGVVLSTGGRKRDVKVTEIEPKQHREVYRPALGEYLRKRRNTLVARNGVQFFGQFPDYVDMVCGVE